MNTHGLALIFDMSQSLRRITFAYESANFDACIEQMGEIQQAINDFVAWRLEQEEAEKVKDARAELAHFVRTP